MGSELAVTSEQPIAPRDNEPGPLMEMTVDQVIAQLAKIDELVKRVMVEGTHYGRIPGCPKPSLLQPGAQTLNLTFRLLPKFTVRVTELGNDHRDYHSTCALYNGAGQFMGSGEGSCSTMETKYRYIGGARKCPKCGAEAIIKGKEEYGGGWYCFPKKDGCGAKFPTGDQSIEGQQVGKIERSDLADVWNTCCKMACKRSLVAADLNVLAVSDKFTQDMEDAKDAVVDSVETAVPAKAAPQAAQQSTQSSAVRVCPQCGATAVHKGKAEYGGGWFCWAKKGGCGATFADGDPAVEVAAKVAPQAAQPDAKPNAVRKPAPKPVANPATKDDGQPAAEALLNAVANLCVAQKVAQADVYKNYGIAPGARPTFTQAMAMIAQLKEGSA